MCSKYCHRQDPPHTHILTGHTHLFADTFMKDLSGYSLQELNAMTGNATTGMSEADMQKVASLARLTAISKKMNMLDSNTSGRYCICV